MRKTLPAALLVSSLLGCVFPSEKDTPKGQHQQWQPRVQATFAPLAGPAPIPADLLESAQHLTLVQLIDLALRSSETTRQSWLRTKSAAAAVARERGAYYPQINGGMSVNDIKRSRFSSSTGGSTGGSSGSSSPSAEGTTYGPWANLSFLLFDFGGREARIEEFKQDLLSANFLHNGQVQRLIYEVQRDFYSYVSLRALAAAQETAVKEAKDNLEAAKTRQNVGLATIADVLQAQTALSQSELQRQYLAGQMGVLRAMLATAVNISPGAPFDAAPVKLEEIQVTGITIQVEELVNQAQQRNPELAAARAAAERAHAHITAVRAQQFPSLFANGRSQNFTKGGSSAEDHIGTVNLSIPVFWGFSLSNELRKARIDAELSASRANFGAQELALRIWTDYFNIQTAVQQVQTSADLLKSAAQSLDVQRARYREGVGSILDLLSAQAALDQARAGQLQARTNWLIAMAELGRDSGTLEPGQFKQE